MIIIIIISISLEEEIRQTVGPSKLFLLHL